MFVFDEEYILFHFKVEMRRANQNLYSMTLTFQKKKAAIEIIIVKYYILLFVH
jgi:hypothetical protein